MIHNVQDRLSYIRNEIKAQKVYTGAVYSQFLVPDNTPSASYSGSASWSGTDDTPVARVRFRFTRADGQTDPPLVNFTCDAMYDPSYQQFAENNGFTFSQIDLSYISMQDIEAYIGEIGEGFVDFYVDFTSPIKTALFSLNSIDLSITCQAIANTRGNLTVERVI